MANIMENLFWNAYAGVYDDIARYYAPYSRLQEYICEKICEAKQGRRILDAGCGTGVLALRLNLKGFSVTAADVSGAMLGILKKKLMQRRIKGITPVKADLNEAFPFNDCEYDAVINVHSLFMLKDIPFSLNEMSRVLKPGGFLIIAHHKPIKLGVVIINIIKNEGFFKGLINVLMLARAGFFNLFLGIRHRRKYGDFSVNSIIFLLQGKGFLLKERKSMYCGFDEIIIMKKKKKNGA